jgi:hypothetical protein
MRPAILSLIAGARPLAAQVAGRTDRLEHANNTEGITDRLVMIQVGQANLGAGGRRLVWLKALRPKGPSSEAERAA